MSVALCTLVLNEMEWLPRLYEQHIDWPELTQWVFVESADQVYAQSNPTRVSPDGLSVDGTTEYLETLSQKDPRVVHIKYGFCSSPDKAQGKCEARNQYLRAIDYLKPTYFLVLDADEFYTKEDQLVINGLVNRKPAYKAFCLRHREIWRPPSIADRPLMESEVVGGFWSIPYCRVWRWQPDLTYSDNHNTPSVEGKGLDRKMARYEGMTYVPQLIHLGFASEAVNRVAKNRYYSDRGEARDSKRAWYVHSRACFETWQPGFTLPRGAKVIPYTGPIPECFQ